MKIQLQIFPNRFLKSIIALVFVIFSLFTSCDLYVNSEEPDIYYEFKDFDILTLGKEISDIIIDPTRPYLYLADFGNNVVLRIDVSGEMRVDKRLILGSHPIALDISPDKNSLVVAFNGESKLELINLETFVSQDKTLPVSLVGINDFICAPDDRIYISGTTEPNAVSIDISTGQEQYEIIRTGELLITDDGSKIFLATDNIVQKYDVSSGYVTQEAWSAPFGFKAAINEFIIGPKGEQLFICLADMNDHNTVKDVYAYSTEDLTQTGKFESKSAGMGVAVSSDGNRIFVAPTDADDAGVFIIEFDGKTKLEKNYYLVAGNLKERGIVIDQNDRFLYAIVNTPGDNDKFEPYNNNSFDLQRIDIK